MYRYADAMYLGAVALPRCNDALLMALSRCIGTLMQFMRAMSQCSER